MQPFITHQPVLLNTLAVSLLIWRVMESILDVKTRRRLRSGIQRQDQGSHVVLIIMIPLGILLGLLMAFKVPATTITFSPALLCWLGIVLIYAGMALRLYAISVLGAFFTVTVAVAPQQRVIETGPYRRIRHPSYTGVLIILLGGGLCLTNWLSLLALLGCALIGFSYRIHVEEGVLQEQLGQPYQEYMRRTKRLIPFLL